MKRLGLLLLLLLCSSMALADTQFLVSDTAYEPSTGNDDTIIYTILPNTSQVVNLSLYLYSSHSSTQANAQVTFFYNDSTSNDVNFSTHSLTGILQVATNPRQGKLVDSIRIYTFRSGTTNGESYLYMVDFWTRAPVPNLTLMVNNSVNGSLINGFCAIFSTGSSLVCSTGNASSIIDPSFQGWNSQNRSLNFELLLNSQEVSGNVTRFASIDGLSCAVNPWFSSSSNCTTAFFNTGCGISSPSFNYYCLVTDEISQRCLDVSMTINASKEAEAKSCYNTVVRLNATSGGYGTLTEWTAIYDNRTGTPTISKTYTNDNAGDSDARLILSLFNNANNDAFTDSTFKAQSLARARQMCIDFVSYNFLATNKISLSNSSRNITYFPAGGANVQSAGLNGADFMYSGYFGDYALALLACGADQDNTTYYSIGNDLVESMFAAANWTTTTGFRVPPGRAFNWTTGATPRAECTTICAPDYIDDPDGKRMTKICGAEKLYRDAGRTLHPALSQYCSEWYAKVTPISYAKEWFANGTRKSNLVDDYDANALGTYLDMSQNLSNIGPRLNLTGNKFNTGTNTYNGAVCQGIYNPSLTMEVLGFLTSRTSLITLGAAGSNSCTSGAANPVTYTQNGITLVLNSPINDSNLTGTSATLNVTVYNTNSSNGLTAGTLPQVLYNTTFATDPTLVGWTLGSWSYNNGAALMNNSVDSGGSMHTQNLTFTQLTNGYRFVIGQQCPPNSTGAKLYIGTDSSSDSGDRILMCDRPSGGGGAGVVLLKHDGGSFSSVSCSQTFCNATITVNLSGNWVNVSNGTASFQDTLANGHLGVNGSCNSFVPGQNMTGGWNITDFNAMNIGSPYNVSTGANESMNVTFYGNAGTKLFQVNTTANGSTATYVWNGLSGTNTWWVNVWSNNSNRNFGNFTFVLYNATTNATYCTVGTALYHNVTGVYNVTVFNITDGSGTPSYFNRTYQDYNFNTSDNNYEKNLTLSTFQAFLSMQALRLFLNTTISAFNMTSGLWLNTTTGGSLTVPANNGTNSLRVAVAGNYTINVTCSVSTPFSTGLCNATGIYDDLVTVGANYDNGGIRNFTLNVTNTTLGGRLYSVNVQNGSVQLPLLQGYYYLYDFYNSTQYADINYSRNATNNSNYYNFSMYVSNAFDLTFRNESTNDILTNQTVYLQILSEARNANYSTTNGTLFIDFLVPGNYTLKYWVDPDVPREYYVTFSGQSYNNITLYLVDEAISQYYLPKVYNQNGYACSQNTVSLLRYFILGNNSGEYRVVEMAKTDSIGQAVLRVVPNIINYKLSFSGSCGNFVSAPQKITSTTNSFTVTSQPTALTSIVGMQGVARSLTFNNATNTFVCTWVDTSNLVVSGTLKITKQYRASVNTSYFLETTDTSIGSIAHTVTDVNDTVYTATCTLDTATAFSVYPDTLVKSFLVGFRNFGLTGVFLSLLVFLVIVFMGGGRVEFIVGGAVGSLFIMGLFGFMFYTWTAAVGLLIIAVIVAYKSRT